MASTKAARSDDTSESSPRRSLNQVRLVIACQAYEAANLMKSAGRPRTFGWLHYASFALRLICALSSREIGQLAFAFAEISSNLA